jgi:hypothetical protein
MKLLRNPWVTSALVVVAIAMVGYQFLPRGGVNPRGFRAQPTPASAATPPASKPKAPPDARTGNSSVSSEGTAESDALPTRGIDREYASAHFANWVNSPRRDPFLLFDTARDQPMLNGATNSPVATWKLDGIWHQTGGQLAIINNRIYKEGDEVTPGYTLEKIEGNEVWFQGPNRKERLGFRELGRIPETNPTNQPPDATEPQKPGQGL